MLRRHIDVKQMVYSNIYNTLILPGYLKKTLSTESGNKFISYSMFSLPGGFSKVFSLMVLSKYPYSDMLCTAVSTGAQGQSEAFLFHLLLLVQTQKPPFFNRLHLKPLVIY